MIVSFMCLSCCVILIIIACLSRVLSAYKALSYIYTVSETIVIIINANEVWSLEGRSMHTPFVEGVAGLMALEFLCRFNLSPAINDPCAALYLSQHLLGLPLALWL